MGTVKGGWEQCYGAVLNRVIHSLRSSGSGIVLALPALLLINVGTLGYFPLEYPDNETSRPMTALSKYTASCFSFFFFLLKKKRGGGWAARPKRSTVAAVVFGAF